MLLVTAPRVNLARSTIVGTFVASGWEHTWSSCTLWCSDLGCMGVTFDIHTKMVLVVDSVCGIEWLCALH